jgi:glycerol-3-phosphate cytidylyltransferase-like family protein
VTPVAVEPSLKYHPGHVEVLTQARYPGRGQCVVGSLTGAVSSQRVTEEHEGTLITVGNREVSVKA